MHHSVRLQCTARDGHVRARLRDRQTLSLSHAHALARRAAATGGIIMNVKRCGPPLQRRDARARGAKGLASRAR